MVLGLKSIYQEIFNMAWVFRYASKNKAFITSDNPFFIKSFSPTNNPLGFGLRSPNTVAFIALTPKVSLTLLRTNTIGTGVSILSDGLVNDFNNYVALFSNRFIVSHNEKLLKHIIKRTQLSTKKPYSSIVEVKMAENEIMTVTKN